MNPRILGIIGGLALVIALLSPFMMGSSKKVEGLYKAAEDLYRQADYENAIAKYTEALEESKKRGVKTEVIDKDFTTLANFQIAVCYSRLADESGDFNHFDTALQFIEKVALNATVPKHQEGLTFLWGHVLYRQDKFELAEAKFKQLIENFPNSLQVESAWYAIGNLNYKLKNYEDSRTAFSNILVGFPNSDFKDDAQLLIAQSFLDEGNYEQAYPEFDKFATEEFKNHPQLHPDAMYKAAFCLNQLNRYDEAISRYTNFITQFPEHSFVTAAYFDQGAIYAKQEDYDNARVNYELALQNTADRNLQSEIQSAIGQTYYNQTDYENAILAYTKLLDEYPDSSFKGEAKVGIADSHFKLENWNDSITAYQSVIEHERSESEDADNPELSFTPYSSFQIGEAYYKLATNQREAGQMDEGNATLELALTWYQKTVDEFPENSVAPHALYGAIWTLNDLERKEDLEALAHEFIEKNKNDDDFDILAAEVQLRFADIKRTEFKQYVEAAEEYAKLWDYRPLPKFHLVKLLGKFFEGRSYYEAAKPEGYQEGDPPESLNTEYLQKSIAAYQDAINMFSDEAFLPGVEEGRYQNFDERTAQVEACLMNEALSHEMLEAWDTARGRYAMIPKTSEYYERALLLIANSYVKQGDKNQAITYYDSILQELEDKNNISLAEIKLADLLRAEEKYEEAAVQYQSVVDGNPTGDYADDALYLVGLCYYRASSDKPELAEKAEAAFNRVIAEHSEKSPKNAIEAYYGLTLVYQDAAEKHGDTSKWALVIQTADAANEQFADSSDAVVLQTLGNIDLLKAAALEKTDVDDIDVIIAGLQRIIDNPGVEEDLRIRSQLKIGHTYYRKQRYQEALDAYKLFADTYPENEIAPNAQYQAAVCYYQIAQNAEDAESEKLAYTNAVSAAEKVAEMTDNADNLISAGYTIGLAKLGLKDTKGAIEAFMQVTALEGQTEDEDRKTLISQSHSRLAELHRDVGDYAAAVKEYQYIIANTEDDDLRGRSYFAMALAQDEHLKVYDTALVSYQNAIQFADNVVKAQSYYRMGLIYQEKLNEFDKALEVYQTLIADYSTEKNTGVASMIADAGIRRSDLFVKLWRLDEAIAEAEISVENMKKDPKATVSQKVAAQYNLGFLYSTKARSLYSDNPGVDLKEYIDTSSLAAGAFFEVSKTAAPLEQADKETVIPYVQSSLFQSGQIYYSVGTGGRRAEMLLAMDPLTDFVKFADLGVFPASNELSGNVETALTYLAFANFDLGRMQIGLDEEVSPQAVAYFDASIKVFRDLVKRYPNAKDAALWQYQAGEAYYNTEQYDKAIPEYQKVRRVNKSHEKAPESLYAIATCYQYLSETAKDAGNAEAEKSYLDKLFETNETLVAEYKNSTFAGEAFINIGNKHYNAALDADLEPSEQVRLYKLAIANYKLALTSPGLSDNAKSTAQGFIDETEESLALNDYKEAKAALSDARQKAKKSEIEAAIEAFKAITVDYPNTKWSDLSYGLLGDAYTILADKEEKYYADALYYFRYLPYTKYKTTVPADPQVEKATNYCTQQAQKVSDYMKLKNIPPRQESAGDN